LNLTKLLLSLVVCGLCQGVLAQPVPPRAGSLQVPDAPPPTRAAPQIQIQPGAAPAGAAGPALAGPRITVGSLRIEGATVYSPSELLALTQFTPGAELTLADLQAMAARITDHYRRNGYFVAQAYLPAQDIRDGAVTIAVSEGRLGNVQLRNHTNLADRVAQSALAGLSPGDVLATEPIERRLLLLSDVPGVIVHSSLVPGSVVGTSDLVVDLSPGQRVTGSIDADNAGNYYTGAYRLGATVNVNDPLGLGDVASLRVLTSGDGLQYARLSYQLQAGRAQVGVAYSDLHYKLGKEFEPLQAHGTAQIASVYGRYPALRSRDDNVYLQLGLDFKKFKDSIDVIPATVDRNSRVLMASIFGDHRDGWGGGGADSYFVTWSSGQLEIETPAARTLDAATAQTEGHFDKLNFNVMRLQRLGSGPFSLYASLNGQIASKNLDVSEKMALGGMYGVRAYPDGEAYADDGYLLTVEARMDLPPLPPGVPGNVQLVAFVDAGSVRTYHDPWFAGNNRRTLSGAGIGVNWAATNNFLVRAFYAHKLGNEPATAAPDRSGRFWVQAVKYF
jgi:hemolysin activation/secretion protein